MKCFYTLLLMIVLVGCSSVKDYSDFDQYSDFVGACYKIKIDSYLYSLNYCMGEAGGCYSIQAFNTNNVDMELPQSWSELVSDESKWLRNIKYLARIGGSSPIEIGGFAKKGTKFKVRKIFNGDQGTLGKFWYISVEFEDPILKNKNIFVPTPHQYLYPSWTKPSRLDQGPIWNDEFVEKCQ